MGYGTESQRLFGQPEPFFIGQELPRPSDGFALEVISKTEVAQHFKEGVMVRCPPDVVDVAGAKAFLARRCPSEVQLDFAEEMILELVHACGSKQNRRIPSGNKDVAGTSDAAFRFEEREVLFT